MRAEAFQQRRGTELKETGEDSGWLPHRTGDAHLFCNGETAMVCIDLKQQVALALLSGLFAKAIQHDFGCGQPATEGAALSFSLP